MSNNNNNNSDSRYRLTPTVTPDQSSNFFAALGHSSSSSSSDSNTTDNNSDTLLTPQAVSLVPDFTRNSLVQRIIEANANRRNTNDESSLSQSSSSSSSSSSNSGNNNIMGTNTDDDLADAIAEAMEAYKTNATATIEKDINLTHIVRFREAMGTALTVLTCNRYSGGYAWLVDTADTHSKRMGMPSKPPDMPVRPEVVGPTAGSTLYKQYKLDLKHYQQCKKVRVACLKLIEQKFPDCLELKKNRYGLPMNFTLQQAFEHLQEEHNTEVSKMEASLQIQRQVMAHSYTHKDSLSCPTFLKQLEEDKEDIDILGTSTISYSHLILCAQQAFRDALKKSTVREIDADWKAECASKGYIGVDELVWRKFKSFYTQAFKEKDKDGILVELSSRSRANSVVDLADLQATVQDQANDLADLGSAFNAMINEQKTVPPVVVSPSTPRDDTTVLTTGTLSQGDIIKLMKQVIAESNLGTTNSNGATHKKPKKWSQWKFWCWTHGANLSHDSTGCKRPALGHKSEATKENPMGGNEKKNHLFLKWHNPATGRPHDTNEGK